MDVIDMSDVAAQPWQTFRDTLVQRLRSNGHTGSYTNWLQRTDDEDDFQDELRSYRLNEATPRIVLHSGNRLYRITTTREVTYGSFESAIVVATDPDDALTLAARTIYALNPETAAAHEVDLTEPGVISEVWASY